MANQAVASDKGVGIAMVLSALALLGAATMVVGPTQMTMAWGFAAAMAAAALAVVSVHVFD